MIELIEMNEVMLVRQVRQKSGIFVIIGGFR